MQPLAAGLTRSAGGAPRTAARVPAAEADYAGYVVERAGRRHLDAATVTPGLSATHTHRGYLYRNGSGDLFTLLGDGDTAVIHNADLAAALDVVAGGTAPVALTGRRGAAGGTPKAVADDKDMCVIPVSVVKDVPGLAQLVLIALTDRQNKLRAADAPASTGELHKMVVNSYKWHRGSIGRACRKLAETEYITSENGRWKLMYEARTDVAQGSKGPSKKDWGRWGGVSFAAALALSVEGRSGVCALRGLIAVSAITGGHKTQVTRASVVEVLNCNASTVTKLFHHLAAEERKHITLDVPAPELWRWGYFVQITPRARGASAITPRARGAPPL